MPEPLMTVRDLASRWQVTTKTIYRWVDAEKIPAPINLHGEFRWNLEIVEAYEMESTGGISPDRRARALSRGGAR